MTKTQSTYRAVQATAPGKLELTDKPLLDPPAMSASALRPVACAIRIPRQWKGYYRSNGREYLGTKRLAGSTPLAKAFRAGKWANAPASDFSAAVADTASIAAMATS